MMRTASVLTLYIILVIAVVQDIKNMKVRNRLIFVGLVLAMTFKIYLDGMSQIIYILWNIFFPVITLYLLYLLGALGAGDIKLFSVVGAFTNFKILTGCMVASFFTGAVIGLGKMLYNRNLKFSLFKGKLFLEEVLHGKVTSYRETMAEEKNLMHFSVAILIGLTIVMCRGFL